MRRLGTGVTEAATRQVRWGFPSAARVLVALVGLVMLTATTNLLAQRGAGRAGRSKPFICVYDCREPSGGNGATNSDLKRFDELMALQATAVQSAAFAVAQQDAENASKQLKAFRQVLEKNPSTSQSDDGPALCQLLDKARTSNQTFLASFSDAQKSGLRELITKVVNADSDLAKETTALNGTFHAHETPANVAGVAGHVDTALGSLQSEQLAVAREMSILPGNENDLTFHLPQVSNSANVGGQQVPITVAGQAIRSSVTNGQSIFDIRLVADLSDLQESVTDIFRPRLNSAPNCGQHIELQQAMLLPQSTGSLVVLRLHHERWICPPGAGSGAEMLVAAGNATVEIKLAPSADPNGELHLLAEVGHVDGDEVFRESLSDGPLGTTLTGQVSNVVLSAIKKGADLGTILPPAAHQAVTIQKVQFQASGAGQLRLVLDGQLRFSDEQIKEFAAQLKQQLSAQTTSPQ